MIKKAVIILLCLVAAIGMAACGKTKQTEEMYTTEAVTEPESDGGEDVVGQETKTLPEETKSGEAQENTVEPVTSEEESIEVSPSSEQEIVDRYEAFLMGNEPLYFHEYVHSDYEGELFDTDKGYTISELIEVFKEEYTLLETNPAIRYSYMDLGNDEAEELAVMFYGMSIYSPEDDSTLVYIVKEIEDRLELCYCYETWARSSSSSNYYGYYTSEGSGGASLHGCKAGYIDATGKWNFIFATENESDINQLYMDPGLGEVPKIAETKEYAGMIIVDTTYFQEILTSDDYYNVERFYTYYVDGEDSDIYASGVYKDIFDEAGVVTYRPEEIEAMILEKERSLGITEEIKNGPELTWEEWK